MKAATSFQRMIASVLECQESLKTCPRDSLKDVLGLMGEELCRCIAEVADDLTDGDASSDPRFDYIKDIAECGIFIREALDVAFVAADDERQDRRSSSSRAPYGVAVDRARL